MPIILVSIPAEGIDTSVSRSISNSVIKHFFRTTLYIQDKKDFDIYFSSIHDLPSMLTYCSRSLSTVSSRTIADVHYLVNLIFLPLFLDFWCNCSCSGLVVIFFCSGKVMIVEFSTENSLIMWSLFKKISILCI